MEELSYKSVKQIYGTALIGSIVNCEDKRLAKESFIYIFVDMKSQSNCLKSVLATMFFNIAND